MAKGLRNKVKKRLRSAKREHHYETKGKYDLQVIASKIHNPHYDLKKDCKLLISC